MSQDIAQIKGYYGKYYNQLLSDRLLDNLDFVGDPYIRNINNLRAPLKFVKMTVGDGVRPLDTSVESSSSERKWTGRDISPAYFMKIIEIIPDDLLETFQSEMLDRDAKKEPFASWAWGEEFNKIADELNISVFNAVKSDDANAAAICDGWNTILKKEITSGAIKANQIAVTAAIDKTNARQAIKSVYDLAPINFTKKSGQVLVSYKVFEAFIEQRNEEYRAKWGIDAPEENMHYVTNSDKRWQIVPKSYMGDSERIILTRPKNLVFGTDKTSDLGKKAKTVDTLHGYKTVVKGVAAFEIADLTLVYTNDRD